uniref:F-box/LRR-repeat protein 15-like leucin rich repeat domain-containing protein n=1 Tax=Kalanchoe fedtschenkoi TaxID=63787 RepID=A0A7N1A5N3_KALFE
MAASSSSLEEEDARINPCINEAVTDDELRAILSRLETEQDKDAFGLVCKRWLRVQSTERKKLCVRAAPHKLREMAARFSNLLELDLSQSVSRSFYPGFTDSDLAVVASAFTCLRVLTLHYCKGISDAGLVAVGKGLPNLQSLDASYCPKLTDKGISAAAEGCKDLQKLHLSGCRLITDRLLLVLSNSCHNLEELGLQGCKNITDAGLTTLVDGCRRMKLLDVNKCHKVGDNGIINVAKACSSSLKSLKLLDCNKVGDQSIFTLARYCNNLETLIIGGCRSISDKSIESLAAACKDSLKILRMDWCLNITDASLTWILTECTYLEALGIGCCEKVTDAAFQGLSNHRSELAIKYLKLSNCSKITVYGLGILLTLCNKSLHYLDVRSCPYITKAGCEQAGLQFPSSCKVNFDGSLVMEPEVLL